jgi:hypothetical protein
MRQERQQEPLVIRDVCTRSDSGDASVQRRRERTRARKDDHARGRECLDRREQQCGLQRPVLEQGLCRCRVWHLWQELARSDRCQLHTTPATYSLSDEGSGMRAPAQDRVGPIDARTLEQTQHVKERAVAVTGGGPVLTEQQRQVGPLCVQRSPTANAARNAADVRSAARSVPVPLSRHTGAAQRAAAAPCWPVGRWYGVASRRRLQARPAAR